MAFVKTENLDGLLKRYFDSSELKVKTKVSSKENKLEVFIEIPIGFSIEDIDETSPDSVFKFIKEKMIESLTGLQILRDYRKSVIEKQVVAEQENENLKKEIKEMEAYKTHFYLAYKLRNGKSL